MTKHKRRTKKDKIIANLRRQINLRSLKDINQDTPTIPKVKSEKQPVAPPQTTTLFTYDPHLIINDLKQTLFMSLIVLVIELSLWLCLR